MKSAYAPLPARTGGKKIPVPYYGLTAAGYPKDIAFSSQVIQFPAHLLKGKFSNCFAVKVSGTSMVEAGIDDGDLVLMRKAEAPEHGAIMLIRYEDQSTIKRVKIEGQKVFLCWEDGSRRRMEVNSADYEVEGKLLNVWRLHQ
jgi:repressor LexA